MSGLWVQSFYSCNSPVDFNKGESQISLDKLGEKFIFSNGKRHLSLPFSTFKKKLEFDEKKRQKTYSQTVYFLVLYLRKVL